MDSAASHIDGLVSALPTLDRPRLPHWGRELAGVLSRGGRLVVAGNGGSAAQAQHLTAELVGRFRGGRSARTVAPVTSCWCCRRRVAARTCSPQSPRHAAWAWSRGR
jgi:hypothetical protein